MTGKLLIVPLMLGLAAVTLAACGSYEWQKQGASDADFKVDRDACMAAGDAGFKDCMASHGWQFRS